MNDQFWKGMLAIPNTLLLCGKSPAELMLGRNSTIPSLVILVQTPATLDNATKEKIRDLKTKEKDTYDQHTGHFLEQLLKSDLIAPTQF